MKKFLLLKKATFPAIMTIISFILFLIVYLMVTIRAIEPYCFRGLIFAIPFIIFGVITFSTVKGKLRTSTSAVLTGIMIPILSFAAFFYFIFLIFVAASISVDDVSKYERVLRLTGFPENELISFFPSKVPQKADNIIFHYNPALLQGGESLILKFKTNSKDIEKYKNEFVNKAKWIGNHALAKEENNELGWKTFDFTEYGYNLPEDFVIYLLHSKPYKKDDWNHGEICIVAVSNQRNEIIFNTEKW